MDLVDPHVVLVMSAIFGLSAGSFLNVLIIRTRRETSPWRGRSSCPHCGHDLAWFELIPVLSFTYLRGKCRHCRKGISWQYPVVEASTAALFTLVAMKFGLTWWTVWGFLITGLMIAIAVYDLRWSLLPDSFTIGLAISGFGFAWMAGTPVSDLVLGAAAGVMFFGLQYVLSGRRWVGSGDILLGGALGALLGWRMLGLSLFLAYFIGAFVASILLLMHRQSSKGTLAFGPYLVLGGFIAWLWGQGLIDWYYAHAIFR